MASKKSASKTTRSRSQVALVVYRKKWNAANKNRKAALTREWRKLNPEESKAQTRKWQQANRAKSRADSMSWAATHPGYAAAYCRKKKEKLAGRPRPAICDVCKCKPLKCLHFDHCHRNGHFRGWLCKGCNHALGNVKDSITTLRKLINYLEQDKARQKEQKNGRKKAE